MRSTYCAALLLPFAATANAADMVQSKHELASEAVACATYYSFAIALSENSGYSLGRQGENAVGMALELANSLEEPLKVRAMFDLQRQQQKKVIDKEGFPRLMVTYLDLCKQILDDPAARLKYWLGR